MQVVHGVILLYAPFVLVGNMVQLCFVLCVCSVGSIVYVCLCLSMQVCVPVSRDLAKKRCTTLLL